MLYDWMFSPFTWGLLLIALLWLCWSRLARSLRIVGVCGAGLMLFMCIPLGANALLLYAESRIPPLAQCGSDNSRLVSMPIVLLSGGFDRRPEAGDDYAALSQDSWRRLRGAVGLWRRSPGSELVIAGGGPYRVKESTVLARLAQDWGVPIGMLRVEAHSTTTWESAMALRYMRPRKIRLVSSALHLPRALIAFRAAGIDACASIEDSEYEAPEDLGYLVPQVSAIEKTEDAVYELIGTVRYRFRAGYMKRSADTVDKRHVQP